MSLHDNVADWEAAKNLFTEALAKPAEHRARYVQAQLDYPAAIREQVLSLLLNADHHTEGVDAIIERAATSVMSSQDPAFVGTYEVLSRIGQGGMSTVYLGRRTTGDYEQQVAIKVLGWRKPEPQLIQRFRAERQILANLDHPHIATLLDGGETEYGVPFLVMEYVDGLPIDAYCAKSALSIEQRLHLFLKVCDAVQHAHQNMVIHRDIKPSNILVNVSGEPRLLDFGIAKLLEPTSGQHLFETQDESRLLTPMNASPEQIMGNKITVATDVYSLGVLLYQLLSGASPYQLTGTSPAELQAAICEKEPASPSSRVTADHDDATLIPTLDVAEVSRQLAGDLDNIVLTALKKEPEQRYASVADFAHDIANYLNHRPVTARPASTWYVLRKFLRRNRAVAVTAATALMLVTIAVGVSIHRITQERDFANQERQKAIATSEFLQEIFVSATPYVAQGMEPTATELIASAEQRIRVELDGQPEVRAELMRVLGEAFYSLSEYERGQRLLEESLTLSRNLYGEVHAEVANAKIALGTLYRDLARYAEAEALIKAGLQTQIELNGYAHFQVWHTLQVLAYHLELRGRWDNAISTNEEALALARTLAGPTRESRYVAQSMSMLGGALHKAGHNDKAQTTLLEALDIYARTLNPDHPIINDARAHLAASYRETGRLEEAEALLKHVIDTKTRVMGDTHVEVATAWNEYSQVLSASGQLDEAISAAEKFVWILDQIYEGPHTNYGAAFNNLGVLTRQVGQLDRSTEYFEKSKEMQDAMGVAEDHPHRSYPIAGIAINLQKQDKHNEALPLLRSALRIREATFPETHRVVSESKLALGVSLMETGQYIEARQLIEGAYAMFQSEQGREHAMTDAARRVLARLDILTDAD